MNQVAFWESQTRKFCLYWDHTSKNLRKYNFTNPSGHLELSTCSRFVTAIAFIFIDEKYELLLKEKKTLDLLQTQLQN